MKKILLLSLALAKIGFCWGPITHYWLSKEQSIGPDEVFCRNSMAPDLFWVGKGILYEKEWGNRGHSPLPISRDDDQDLKKKNYLLYGNDKENFAYIIKLCSYTGDEGIWRGFGSHIASDWVAHNPKFLSLPEALPKGDKDPVMKYHHNIEWDMDYYLYLTKGGLPIDILPLPRVSLKTKPKLIWRALVNKRLIELKRKSPNKPDSDLKNEAIGSATSQCPIGAIKLSAIAWAELILAQNIRCLKRKAIDTLTGSLEAFKSQWPNSADGKPALANYTESWFSIRNWLDWTWYLPPSQYGTAGVPPLNVTSKPDSIQTGSMDDPDKIWFEVVDKAKDENLFSIIEREDSEGNYEIEVSCTNETRLNEIFDEVVVYHKTNPTSDSDLVLAQVMEKVFLKPYITPDYNPPTIANLTPSQNQATQAKPTISANITDDKSGVGSITLKIDDQEVSFSFSPQTGRLSYIPSSPLSSGTHTLFLQALDNAGNPTFPERGTFSVDADPPLITNPKMVPSIVTLRQNITISAYVVDSLSGVGSVTIDLSSIGGLLNQP
ncbi:MAG: Ig-like domain-containing protein, partial [bacterium]